MTDEEKKAIEIIKFLQDKCIQENGTGMMPIYRIDDLANAIKILLNLIENQYNEIEELKKLMAHKNGYTKQLEEDLFENASNYVVSKDKIRAKIKELDEKWHVLYRDSEVKDILKELLEEE